MVTQVILKGQIPTCEKCYKEMPMSGVCSCGWICVIDEVTREEIVECREERGGRFICLFCRTKDYCLNKEYLKWLREEFLNY